MNEEGKIILENLTDNIKILNKNTLYLCRHVTSTESRLENIEVAMKINDKNTDLYGKQISNIKGKMLGISTTMAIVISLVISLTI